MNRSLDVEVKVGIFVVLGLFLTAVALIMAGGEKSLFSREMKYTVHYKQVDGLQVGSLVKVAGYKVGVVDEMKFQEDGQIELKLSVLPKYGKLIKEDSTAQVGTQGVLGDKFINISVGSPTAKVLPDGATLNAEVGKEIKDYLSQGDQLISSLNSSMRHLESILSSFNKDNRAETIFKGLSATAASMQVATKDLPTAAKDIQSVANHLRSVASKIDRGDGTLGALVNDPSLYDDMKALLGGANRNRVLKYFIKKSVEESRDAAKEGEPQAKK